MRLSFNENLLNLVGFLRSEKDGEKYEKENKDWRSYWKRFDQNFMLPLFTLSKVTLVETMPKWTECFAKCLTTSEQLTSGNDQDEVTEIILKRINIFLINFFNL